MPATDLPGPIRHAIATGVMVPLNALEGAELSSLLDDRFPFSGSFIDWRRTAHHASHSELSAVAVEELFPAFFHEHLGVGERIAELAFYANDGIPLKLRTRVGAIEAHLRAFIDLPHTSYFIAGDGSWCLTLRMNGDMDFGRSPMS
jgi:hypothetical protein